MTAGAPAQSDADTVPEFISGASAAVRLVRAAADKLTVLQPGHLHFRLGLIGLLLVIIPGLTLL